MFIKPSEFKKNIKMAYKSVFGLKVGQMEELVIIAGSDWYMEVGAEELTKECKAELIRLIKDLPKEGEAYTFYEKDPPQQLAVLALYEAIWKSDYKPEGEYNVTMLGYDDMCILQNGTERKVAVLTRLIDMVDIGLVGGSETVPDAWEDMGHGKLALRNNEMVYVVDYRGESDEKYSPLLDALKGVDLNALRYTC